MWSTRFCVASILDLFQPYWTAHNDYLLNLIHVCMGSYATFGYKHRNDTAPRGWSSVNRVMAHTFHWPPSNGPSGHCVLHCCAHLVSVKAESSDNQTLSLVCQLIHSLTCSLVQRLCQGRRHVVHALVGSPWRQANEDRTAESVKKIKLCSHT